MVDDLRGNEKYNKKMHFLKDIFQRIRSDKLCYMGKEIKLDEKLCEEVFNYLTKEMIKEEDKYFQKLLEIITFIPFIDIIVKTVIERISFNKFYFNV